MRTRLGVLAFACIAFTSTTASAQEVVASCGVSVLDGVLAVDLDCSGFPSGVAVEDGGTLDLAGHTLIAGSLVGVGCTDECTIEGSGGKITGGGGSGVIGRTVHISNTEVSGIDDHGVSGIRSVDVTGCTILDNLGYGVMGWGRRANVTDSTLSGNAVAVSSIRIVSVAGSTISGNSWGVHGQRRGTITDSSVTGNSNSGASGRKLTATNSNISNNGEDCSYAPGCSDIATQLRPIVENVTCDTSARVGRPPADELPTGESWGVCTND